ncbi:MAG: hypothetical protein HQK91_04625 [Nitrospirae bacterium]|nr:hypothetical protein [Nitrospirota bacterium]MBF0540718.1 hypothetical protein [Nitrospirota bacterium]
MAEEPKIAEELHKMQYQPLMPVEKSLIKWSLSIGVISLIFFYWLSVTFFPGAH